MKTSPNERSGEGASRLAWRRARPENRSRPSGADWACRRESIDLVEVATRLLGPPTGRRGESGGRRLWWRCPFHDDANPSFCLEPGKPRWKCFGCGEHGDAIDLARKLRGLDFREAVSLIAGPTPTGSAHVPRKPAHVPRKPAPLKPVTSKPKPDADADAAMELAEQSAARLWEASGAEGLAMLRARGLPDAVIRGAGLGWTPGVSVPMADGIRFARFRGVTIPWFSPDGLELLKIRQPDGRQPRYAEAYRRRPTHYPGIPLSMIDAGWPIVVVEGELDAILLGWQLDRMAAVITMGSASSRPTEAMRVELHRLGPIFLATDADEAGERCARTWPRRGVRVRPPTPHKDWTEAHLAGLDLRRWWTAHLESGTP